MILILGICIPSYRRISVRYSIRLDFILDYYINRNRKMIFDYSSQFCTRIFVYLLLVLTFFLSMEILYLLLDLSSSRYLRHLIDAFLIAFPVLCLKWKCYLFPYLLFFLSYFFSLSFYFKTYHTIMPLTLILWLVI